MRRMPHAALLIAGASLLAACSSSSGTSTATTAVPAATSTTAAAPTTTTPAAPLAATLRPGPAQLAVLGATPGTPLTLLGGAGVQAGTVDEQGSLLWRGLAPGDYQVTSADGAAASATVPGLDEVPPQSFYDAQSLEPGFGYLTTRDGTTLSINVALPDDVAEGPFPTVVEYSGYTPSNPDDTTFAQLYTSLGFAYVGVNIRGTGCSGGSYQFFEPVQSLDGYDAIEAIAAQPWVQDHQVGMVGISYPGISQLFVAQTEPPHLEAITPLSVLDDSYNATLYPGGILNTGFAVPWTADRQDQAKPYGQSWAKDRADAGDTTCADNQKLRLQNPDLLQMIKDHPFYEDATYGGIAPRTFVDKINVPVFLAGAWQDEQTGGHFPTMLDKFTSSPHVYATLVNGLHTESISLGILPEYVEFLQLYVAHTAPDLSKARFAAPILASSITGVGGLSLPASDLEGLSYADALAAFEAKPPIRVLFEEGAADGAPANSPLPRWEQRFSSWPIPSAVATSWYLQAGTVLGAAPGAADAPAASYLADPKAVPATFYDGGSNAIWQADVAYHWQPIPAANAASWTSAPLTTDTVIVGTGSVDLWLRSSAADTDVEVTISEVRPDGSETYVQSGWLRASQRKLDDSVSTELRPVATHHEADAAPLPSGEFTPVRVELFPVAHPFRAGSRLKLTVNAPDGNRPVWAFDTLPGGETNEIAQDAAHPSKVVLPVVPGVTVPAGVAACGSLRGQPCRPAP